LPAGRFDRQARSARLQRIVGRRHSFVAPPGKTLAEQLAVERRVFVRRSTIYITCVGNHLTPKPDAANPRQVDVMVMQDFMLLWTSPLPKKREDPDHQFNYLTFSISNVYSGGYSKIQIKGINRNIPPIKASTDNCSRLMCPVKSLYPSFFNVTVRIVPAAALSE
jgi:hypothetical protein